MTLENENKLRNDVIQKVRIYADNKYKTDNLKFVPGKSIIQSSGRCIGAEEVINIVEAALDGWLTTGRFNEEFETKISKYVGVESAITVNSGSSANLVAFMTLTSNLLGDRALKKGDEVITVAAGFPTTVNPIIQAGAIPVFLDVDIPTYNIDTSQLNNALTTKTKAVVIAHTLGNPFNVQEIKDFCIKNNLWLIEDCCDALGSTYSNKKVGTFGDLSTLSFYPAHHITMGEGGLVMTSNPLLSRIAKSIREWGRDCWCGPGQNNTCGKRYCWKLGELPEGFDHKYTYSHLGYNLKITDMQAACGLAQLDKLEHFIDIRRDNFQLWNKYLDDIQDIIILPKATQNTNPSWFGYPITISGDCGIERADLINNLWSKNIDTRMLFAGDLRAQPYMKDVNYISVGKLENTKKIMNKTFWVGLYPGITEEMIEYAANQIKTYLKF